MAEHFAANTWFGIETCCDCGMVFAMPLDLQRKLKNHPRTSFYCPKGHEQWYVGETEESKLKRELERKNEMLANANARAERINQEREAIAKAHRKMRVRVMNGVCPCCNRTFQNLMAHMRTEHPDFNEIQSLAVLRQAFGMTQAAVAKEAGVSTAYVSLYEHGKNLPEYAKEALESWVGKHTAAGVVGADPA